MVNVLKSSALFFLLFSFISACSTQKKIIQVQQGILDLSEYDFEKDGLIPLKGSWLFYWQKFVQAQDFQQLDSASLNYITVPKIWRHFQHQGKPVGPVGFGTYYLRIKLPKKNLKLALNLSTVGTAYKLYINDRLVTQCGTPGTSKKTTAPFYQPQVVDFTNTSQEIDIILQVANHHYSFGGIWWEIELGLETELRTQREQSSTADFFLLGSIFIIALYHLGLFWIRRKSKSALYFSFVCLIAALRILVTDKYLINTLFNLSWFISIRLEYISLNLGPLAFLWFFYSLFPKEFSKKILHIVNVIFSLISLLILFLSPLQFPHTLIASQLTILAVGLYVMFGLVKSAIRKREGATLFVVGFLILFVTVFNDILFTNGLINTGHQFGLGLFIFIFSQALVLSFRFSKSFTHAEELSEKLNETNKNLEPMVDFRTTELRKGNKMLNQFVDELDAINNVLSKKNQDITDSINYASSIQKAMLPLLEDITKAIPENFIFFKPRDIVSGDFYWFTSIVNKQSKHTEKLVIAAVDCTGHGIPGAFMSLLGIESLNNIVNQLKITEPKEVLYELHEHISSTLRQRLNNIRDGMDIALCTIDLPQKKMAFAGAHNPLFFIRDNELHVIRGSPISIGGLVEGKGFEQHVLELHGDEIFYIFTDGIQDQFGGPKKRKFMKRRLRELLLKNHQNSMETQKQALKDAIEHWMTEGKEKQIDDMLVIGFRFGFS